MPSLKLNASDIWNFDFNFQLDSKKQFLRFFYKKSLADDDIYQHTWHPFSTLYQNSVCHEWRTKQNTFAQSRFSRTEFKPALDFTTLKKAIELQPLEEQPLWYKLYQYRLVVIYSISDAAYAGEVRAKFLVPMTDYLLNHSSILSMILYMDRVNEQVCSFELWLFCSTQLKYLELKAVWPAFNQLNYQIDCVFTPSGELSLCWIERFYSEIFFNPTILSRAAYFITFTCKTSIDLVHILRNLEWVKTAGRIRDCGKYVQDFQDVFNEGLRDRFFSVFLKQTAIVLYLPWILGYGQDYTAVDKTTAIPFGLIWQAFSYDVQDDWIAVCVDPALAEYYHPSRIIKRRGTDEQKLQFKKLKEEFLLI